MRAPNYYAHPGFERAGLRRREPDWIRERVLDPASVFIPVWRNQNLVSSECSRPSILIKLRSITRTLLEQFARHIFLVSSGKFFHRFHQFFYSKVFREAQWSAPPGRETGAENHPVIGVLR